MVTANRIEAEHPVLRREQTLAIVLAASEWPLYSGFHASPSFRDSAVAIVDYLRSSEGLNLSPRNMRVLIDSFDDLPEVLRQVRTFISDRRSDLLRIGTPVTDLLLYYIGHGGFGDRDRFFLSIRATDENDPLATSITADSLGRLLRDVAGGLRTYLVLDCCFAASVVEGFMSDGPLGIAEAQLQDALPPQGDALAINAGKLPSYGTALLCASASRERAKAPLDLPYTMFTGSLLEVLKNGHPDRPGWLSLNDMQQLVTIRLREQFAEKAVLPEVHAPQQRMGRVDIVPLFPNPPYLAAHGAEATGTSLLRAPGFTLPNQSGGIRPLIRQAASRLSSAPAIYAATAIIMAISAGGAGFLWWHLNADKHVEPGNLSNGSKEVPAMPSPTELTRACYGNIPQSAEEFSSTRICISGQALANDDPIDTHRPGAEIRKALTGRDIVDVFFDLDSVWILASRWTSRQPIPTNLDGSLFPYRDMFIIHVKSDTDVAVSDAFTVLPVTYLQPDAIIYRNGNNIECFINYLDASRGEYNMIGGLFRFDPLTLNEVHAENLFTDVNWGWYPQFVDGKLKHWSSEGGYYWVFDKTKDGEASPITARQAFKISQATKSAGLLPPDSRSKLIGGIVDLAVRKFNSP